MSQLRINPQIALDPKVHAAQPRECIGGPCDGLTRWVPDGYVLILARVLPDEISTTALPLGGEHDMIALAKMMRTYCGHYLIDGKVLRFFEDEHETPIVLDAPTPAAP